MPLTRLNYHVVFSTDRRKPCLKNLHLRFLFPVIGGITKRAGGRPVAIDGWHDHIHIVCVLPATEDLASYVSKVKSQATGALKSKFDEHSDFRWSPGYGAFTVSPKHLPEITQYVRQQQEIHRHREGRPEYEDWERRP
jgi:REP element-mobilizing transposase RayT